MASNQTKNYQLNQWEASDPVLRSDFNSDNAKIEAALTDLEKRKCGTDALMAVANIVGQVNNDLSALKKRVEALEKAVNCQTKCNRK